MNRRNFIAISALAGMTPGQLARVMRGAEPNPSQQDTRNKMWLLKQLLSTPQAGFPTLTPTFAAMFAPGTGPVQLVRSETWADFTARTQAQSNNGYVLSAMTSIQNLNRTWFYGAYQKGTGNYQLFQTSDPSAFQQMFTQLQNTHKLVDFNIAWELGNLSYSGYWLANAASAKPAGQTLIWDLSLNDLTSQWKTLSAQGQLMTRIQAYPQNAGTMYSALFAPSKDGYLLDYGPADTFFTDVNGKFSGNSLAGIAFDPTSGDMLGCWLNKVTPSEFVSNQNWDALTATAQKASAGGMVLTAMAAYPNAPSFDDYFETNEAPFVEGYAYAVALNGTVIANGEGFARSANESNHPSVPYTPDSRMNLASVSKAITGIALEVLLVQNPTYTLDTPFWPLIQNQVPTPDPSVKVVTLRNLAEMKSGMLQQTAEGPLNPPAPYTDIWSYLTSYLSQPLTGTPGVTYFYDNTNFTILQGVIEEVSGMDYVDYVTQNVLVPAGIDPTIFNATPDPQNIATLQYSGPQDTRPGNYWTPLTFVAPGGWISSVRELIKILIAMRGTKVLPASAVTEMFNDLIGWDGEVVGNFGTYYYKNGGLTNTSNPPQQLNTCVVRLGEGYDVALIANSEGPIDVVTQCINAFESRGVPLASEPTNAPSIISVVQGASFQPNCAPGSYVSIIGAGFQGPAVNWAPTTTLPTELNEVKVKVGSRYAYVAYAGPTQVNFLLPSGVPAGIQNLELTMPGGGMTTSIQINPVAPGLFAYKLNGKSYPVALFAGGSVIVAAVGALSSTSRPASAGDIIEFYGTGMGPTNPAAPDGVVFSKSYPAANLAAFQMTIGGQAATVSFAGLVGAGLYQINVQVPSGLSGGDQPVVLTVSGIAAQPNLMLTIAA
jgi:uncharacterized protein (TIGR03437 family)